METIILCGIQASGKSTFYKARFADSHLRLNLDMLRTRTREGVLLHACLAAKQPFVVDNTNPTAELRGRYVALAHAAGFEAHVYYLDCPLQEALQHNAARDRVVPERAIKATARKLEVPAMDEGMDRLFFVTMTEDWGIEVQEVTG